MFWFTLVSIVHIIYNFIQKFFYKTQDFLVIR